MRNRITAVFDTRVQAEYARDELMLTGFESDAIVLVSSCETPDEAWVSGAVTSVGDGYTVGDDTQNFFRRMFQCSSEDAGSLIYWEAVRRGKVVLEVEVESDADFEIATDIIEDLRLCWTDFGE